MNSLTTNRITVIRFISLCFFAEILFFSGNYLLTSDELYFNTFSDTISYERIEQIIQKSKRWAWVSYSIIPLIYFTKLSLVTTCLALSFFFTNNKFNFKAFFNISIFSELIFLFPILIKLLWFLFVQTDYNLNDLTLFYPLSALNLIDTTDIPRYWLAPLQTLNLFEVGYWFLLAYGVADATGFSVKRSFGLVMSSYGVGLVLWVVLVMFLTITYS